MYQLRTLGELTLHRLEQGGEVEVLRGSKTLLIPAWLATRPGATARRDDLAEFLWPDQSRAGALRALRQALFFLSRHAADLFAKDDEVIRLDRDRIGVDLLDFDEAVRAEDYRRALELYRGRFALGVERKVGVEVEHWIEDQNGRITVALEVAYARLISEAVSANDAGEAERLARSFLEHNPLDESRHQVLIRTLKATGNQVAALRAFEAYRAMVRREHGDELPGDLADSMERLRSTLTVPRMAPEAEPASPPSVPPQVEAAPTDLPVRLGAIPEAVGRRPLRRSALLIALGAGVTLILALTVMVVRTGEGRSAALEGVRATLLAIMDGTGPESVARLSIRRGRFRVGQPRPAPLPFAVPGPVGALMAYAEPAPDGWNVAVRDGERSRRTLTGFPGDEFPVGWSPDGRYLLITRVTAEGGNRERAHTLYYFDLAGDSLHALIELGRTEWPEVAWSPDGTQIAFAARVAGSPDVFVIDFDGHQVRNLTRHYAVDRSPSWAPDRSAIAFVSTRDGSADLYLVGPDGSDLRPLTRLTGDERLPTWLSPTTLLFLAGGDQPEFWAMDLASGRASRIQQAPPQITRITAAGGSGQPWLEGIRIRPRPRVGSPGQYLALRVDAAGPEGRPVAFGGFPLRWSSLDTTVMRVEADGLAQLVGEGTARIRVTAGGWRSDTVRFPVGQVTIAGLAPFFEEDWGSGLDTATWRPFGEPQPLVVARGGRLDRAALASNGDEFFESGVVTRESFDLRGGLTVEVEGQVPFTGRPGQVFGFQLVPESATDSALAYGRVDPAAALRLTGPDRSEAGETVVISGGATQVLPMPAGLGDWQTYALQVTPEGTAQLLVNGRLYWQSEEPLPRTVLRATRLALGFRSFGTRLLHGAVRVYRGPKYLLHGQAASPE